MGRSMASDLRHGGVKMLARLQLVGTLEVSSNATRLKSFPKLQWLLETMKLVTHRWSQSSRSGKKMEFASTAMWRTNEGRKRTYCGEKKRWEAGHKNGDSSPAAQQLPCPCAAARASIRHGDTRIGLAINKRLRLADDPSPDHIITCVSHGPTSASCMGWPWQGFVAADAWRVQTDTSYALKESQFKVTPVKDRMKLSRH